VEAIVKQRKVKREEIVQNMIKKLNKYDEEANILFNKELKLRHDRKYSTKASIDKKQRQNRTLYLEDFT
jgi:Asp-tRNA(Asn)/Glu-tRNA(Gln) amidotransferase A subunit family amidase